MITYVALAAPAAGFEGAGGAPVALAAPGFADIGPLERVSDIFWNRERQRLSSWLCSKGV